MKKIIFPLLLSLVFCMVYSYVFDSKLDLNGDNANYLHYAANMAKGHGYSVLSPDGFSPASQYPPAYSAFLSFFMLFGIQNLVFFKILNGLLLLAGLLLLFYMVDKTTGNRALAFVCALLPVFSPDIQHFSNIVMSEMLFFTFTALCFFALYKYSEKKHSCFLKSPWFYLITVFASGAYYTRTVGMALVAAVIVFFLFRREWKQAAFSLLGIIMLNIPWSIRNSIYDIKSRYFGTIMTVNPWRPEEGTVSSLSELINKMIVNFDETVIKSFKAILFPFMQIDYGTPSGFMAVAGGLLILAAVLYGVWNMGSLRWAMIAYLLGQIGLFMLWHGGNGARYVVPVAPFIFVGFYSGLYHAVLLAVKKKSPKKKKAEKEKKPAAYTYLSYAFLIFAVFMWKPVAMLAEAARQPVPPAYKNYFSIAKDMQRQLPAGTVCAVRKPELFRYYASGIFPVHYAFSTDTKEVVADLIKKNVDYVILEQLGYSSTPRYLYPAIQQYPDLFPVVRHLPNPDTYLLKFEREKAIAQLNVTDSIK